ncbi:ACP S-malonyltransferase [Streptomyces sp. UNOB3_S3]|uniref:ACP S-malonyltransferase n=1 Tax=Streptomyces sp. UNOB3_S3 TaxID=2871682 RepID=UPI001E647A29|nr:ACP S-malonyltransferase [Streptomyces sp. UNOB3_S3]MCC3778317.1 ACP S-malonyltransferase [Streptomyces sp. UNOB3_S3]
MATTHDTGATPFAALFPGQGVQRRGMGARWRGTPSWSLVDTVSEASGHDVAELLLDAGTETLARTDLAQISVFTASLLSWTEFRDAHPEARVTAFAGHSLGEYTALVAAGALTAADGARLVGARGRAMADAARHRPGAMAAVMGADPEAVEELTARVRRDGADLADPADPADLWVANLNSPQQTVVAGSPDAVEAAGALALANGWRYSVLPVSAACHTAYMAPASRALATALDEVTFRPAHAPVVSNVDARPHTEGRDWPALCARQLVSPVRWNDTLHTLVTGLGSPRLTDFGPGRTLAALARRVFPDVPAEPVAGARPVAV